MPIKNLKDEWTKAHTPVAISTDDSNKDEPIEHVCPFCNVIVRRLASIAEKEGLFCNHCHSSFWPPDARTKSKLTTSKGIDSKETLVATISYNPEDMVSQQTISLISSTSSLCRNLSLVSLVNHHN